MNVACPMAGCPRKVAGKRKGRDACARRAGRGASAAADGRDHEGLRLRRAKGQGATTGPLRRPSLADSLPLHVRAECRWLAERWLPRLLVLRRSDRAPLASPCAQHLVCARVARTACEHPAISETHVVLRPYVARQRVLPR